MPYRIEYGTTVPERYQKKNHPQRLQIMTAACLLVFVILIGQFFPAGLDMLRTVLIPDEKSVTQTALDGFVANIQCGESVGDAFFVFCAQILESDSAILS